MVNIWLCKVHNDKVAKCTDCALTKWHSENGKAPFHKAPASPVLALKFPPCEGYLGIGPDWPQT